MNYLLTNGCIYCLPDDKTFKLTYYNKRSEGLINLLEEYMDAV